MIDEIVKAVQEEINTRYKDTGCTVIFKDDFSAKNWPTYRMPLVLIEVQPDTDFQQMFGGWTLCDWAFSLSAYDYFPDITSLDPTSFSSERLKNADVLRAYFSNYAIFQSPEMKAAIEDYGVTWTLTRVSPADSLEHPDGLCKGFKFIFNTLSWDQETTGTAQKYALTEINQINPPFDS